MNNGSPSISSNIDNFIEKSRRYLQPGEKPPKGVRVQTGKRGAKFYDTTPRKKKTVSPESMKGKWMNRKPKVPVFVTIDVKETKGKQRKQKPYSVEKRTQWITVDRALKGGYEIDFEKLNDRLHERPAYEEEFVLYSPEDSRRMHEHEGVKGEHSISKKHSGNKASEAHDVEKNTYSQLYSTLQTKKTPEERRIRQKIAEKTAKLENLLKKKYPKKIHTRKRNTLLNEINQAKKELKEKCGVELVPTRMKPKKEKDRGVRFEVEETPSVQEPNWMDDYHVNRTFDQEISFKGKSYKADVFTSAGTNNAVYVFQVPERKVQIFVADPYEREAVETIPGKWYVGTEKLGTKSFPSEGAAMRAVELIFSDPDLRSAVLMKQLELISVVSDLKKQIFMKQLDLQKRMIINKVEELISAPTNVMPVDNVEDGFKVFSQFQSGDDKVTLEGDRSQYKVCTNGIPSVTTDSFQEALAKYYSSVSRIIDTQNEDKDIGLELFGEHVLNTSRKTRKLMAELDKMVEVKMLENIDYSDLSLPFNPEIIMKYEPQGDFFGIVPPAHNSEEVECSPEDGRAIGRKDLGEKEYKREKKQNKEQDPISENDASGIQPAIVTKEMNQPQLTEAFPEEDKRHEIIEKPVKVKETYQQNLRNPENIAIEQRYGTQ